MDELLVRDGAQWLLFVNENRAPSRLRFSIFHGIGHFCLPGHRELNYLSRGCLVRPWTTRSYERQAHAFAAVMNMPRRRFRGDMADLPLALSSVESLAGRYLASVENAAIHYVTLSDAPCCLLWLRPDYDSSGLRLPDSPLKVRYQVRSPALPFFIRPGTCVPPEDELFCPCSEAEFLTEGEAAGPLLGLRREAKLWVECLPQGHVGAVLALVRPTPMPPGSPVYRDWDWEQIE